MNRAISRREFAAVPALLVGAAASAFGQRTLLTAGEVVERIKANLGVPWRDTTYRDTQLQLRIAADQTCSDRARALQQIGVDHVALRTYQPYAQALHRAFALRARRMSR